MSVTGRPDGTGEAVAHLVLFDGATPRRVALDPRASHVLGTDPGCDIVLAFGRRIFPRHASLALEQRGWRLHKLYAPAEVAVDGQAVEDTILEGGEVLLLGDVRVEFRNPAQRGVGAAPGTRPAPRGLGRTSAARPVTRTRLSGTVTIGRDPTNTISLAHPQISRFHADIALRGDTWWVADLHSTNGTFVNGSPVQACALRKGDVISISDYVFHFDGQELEQESFEGTARIDAIDLRRVVQGGQVILHDVSLSIYPREFVAIVGVSGAGKSTVMSALSGFRPADQGLVLVNGVDFYRHFDAFRSTLGYVPQDDIIHSELTVERALAYAARLRMPDDTRRGEIDRRVHEVLEDLQLTERRHVQISRLSGGQRKRVSIGVELLTRPRLFYLDEPTSGLDPGLEADMMQIFRHMADQGHTTIVITHATKNLLMCDQIAFLAKGGHLAFFGPPHDALHYFGADDFLDIYLKLDRERTPEEWARAFACSPERRATVKSRLDEVGSVIDEARRAETPAQARPARSRPSRRSPVRQWGVLTRRYLEILVRDVRNFAILLSQAPLMGLLLVLAYPPDVLSETTGDYNRAKSLIFFLVCISIWFGTNNAAREIAKEASIWRRERTVNLGIVPYVLSKVWVLFTLGAVQSLIMLIMVSLKVDLPGGFETAARLYVVFLLVCTAGLCMGLMVSAMVSNPDKAASMIPILLIPQIVFSGAMMPLSGASDLLSNLTLSKWGLELMGSITRIWTVPLFTYPYIKRSPETAFDIIPATHYLVLAGFIVVFVLACCLFLKMKDAARD